MNERSGQRLAVMVHGGAGKFSADLGEKKLPVMAEAMDAAWDSLREGVPGEFAVAAALRVMEGCEYFNAGFGGYPNAHGIVLLDVGLMRGSREFVSLINVRRVKYPSAVALDMLQKHRALMTIWTHELMQALDQSPDFVKERYGLVEKHEDLVAPFVRRLLKNKERLELEQGDGVHGTVGCVVRDTRGELFSGTSTGGVSLKYNGRVGDTPIIGSGVFADNEIAALSTTGHGESILLSMLSGFIVAEMRRQLRADPLAFKKNSRLLREIMDAEFDEMERKANGRGGAIIVIPAEGEPDYAFNSEMVSVGLRTGTLDAVDRNEVFVAYKDGRRKMLEK